ncbi:hypothetical protein OBBRIDRAFT_797368 [Obba rivulosa]|uniref:Uncharacterized protein n=1 Tax=Obba rivulosa TaxID=1052685 RepID=A0A8E2AT85_9APHY|nr:hypothetical protein OBBRIDRAFT_797368 [Obba rivulosa]
MGATDLPPELNEHIIDFLEDDRAALHACAATWSGWTPFCRKYLFRALSLEDARFAEFLAILAASPYVGKFVRELYVTFEEFEEFESEEFEHFKTIVPHLGGVEEFHYTSGHWALPDISTLKNLGPVVRLVLCDAASLPTYGDLARFLGNFPLVEDLELLQCDGIDYENRKHLPALTVALQRMPLKWLVVEDVGIMPVIADCISQFPEPQLTSLSFDYSSLPEDWKYLPHFDPLVRWPKLHLQELSFDLHSENSPYDEAAHGPYPAQAQGHQAMKYSVFSNRYQTQRLSNFVRTLRSCGHVEVLRISTNMAGILDLAHLFGECGLHLTKSDEIHVEVLCQTSEDFELMTVSHWARSLLVFPGMLSQDWVLPGKKTFTVHCDHPGDRAAYIKVRDWALSQLSHLLPEQHVVVQFEGIPEA